jgi:hypothetical protein
MKRILSLKNLSVFLFIGVLVACATYQTKIAESRRLIKEGQVKAALEKLEPLAEKKSDDQLVYLMDYATALQIDGQFKKSNDVFLQAEKLVDQNDYHSVSNIALATLGSESMIQYKGESYEKILINAYLALNYLMLHEFDDAIVEVRKVNDKINKIRQEARKDYEQNPFANYLGGLIWESDGRFDDAYISYSESYKIDATNGFLPEDLIRAAKKSRRLDDYQQWKKEFPQVKENPDWYDSKKGELVVVLQQGWGPEKHPVPGNTSFPRLYPVNNMTNFTKLTVDGVGTFQSRMVYNLEKVVIKTLDDDVGWLIARKVGATAAKMIVADQVRQKTNPLLGDLAYIFMSASDQADLRQWSTLPKTFQLARVWLPTGDYKISLQGMTGAGMPSGERLDDVKISVRAGHKTFLSWRSLR